MEWWVWALIALVVIIIILMFLAWLGRNSDEDDDNPFRSRAKKLGDCCMKGIKKLFGGN